jgi:DNA polymerase II large subunit
MLFGSYLAAYDAAIAARNKCRDSEGMPESQEVCDIGDRLQAVTGIHGIAEQFRKYDLSLPSLQTALKVSEDIALGHFGFLEREEILNLAARAALSVVTSAVSFVPSENITKIVVKKNGDGTSYPAIIFGRIAGNISPLQAACLLLVIDHVRLILGLSKYHVNSMGDDEVARFVEEARTYEREVGSFQFRFNDDDLRLALRNLAIEIDGYPTEDVEVVANRGLTRIGTDKLRGGALQVLVDGLLGRSSRLLEMALRFQIPEWDWLSNVKSGKRVLEPDDAQTYILNAKPGKPVLSLPNRPGGFRLRYGRGPNTGFGCLGFHPALLELLGSPLTTGTQIKTSIASRSGSTAVVSSLEPPIVRLRTGELRRVESVDDAKSLHEQVDKVIHLGDILVSPDDFHMGDIPLESPSYVEEWWTLDLRKSIDDRHMNLQQLSELVNVEAERIQAVLSNHSVLRLTLSDALRLSDTLGIPLHPRFLFYWDLVSVRDVFNLRQRIIDYKDPAADSAKLTFTSPTEVKPILETLGIPHILLGTTVVVSGEDAKAVFLTLAPDKPIPLGATYSDTLTLLKFLSGLDIRRKSSTFVGIAMRRLELAGERRMRPPVHSLFPVGTKPGQSRDLTQISQTPSYVEIRVRLCPTCGSRSPYESCPFCESPTTTVYFCPNCRKEVPSAVCPECSTTATDHMPTIPRIEDLLRAASTALGLQPYPPLKGVARLTSSSFVPERIEKGILRQRHNLTCFKDGTVRYDAVNAPLTHFRPTQFKMSVERLRGLGYAFDAFGQALISDEQLVELKPQDVIVPEGSADHLKRLSAYLDDLLTRYFKTDPYYSLHTEGSLAGSLIVGISPKASVGVVGRIIGFTSAQVCYAHPLWHGAKHRDCGGDVDSFTLLLDVLLNFSPKLCPSQIGGLTDTPALIEPVILPSTLPKQPSPLGFMKAYPLDFYLRASERPTLRSLTESLPLSDGGNQVALIPPFQFTHPTSVIVSSQVKSLYSIPGPMPDKVSRQIAVASRIQAVDVDRLVSSLLNNYLLKEIIASLRSYSTQRFRCKGCGEMYRRPPLKGTCLTCGRELLPTVTLSSVEKYAMLAGELARSYQITQTTRDKVTLTLENLQLLSESKQQTSIADFT